MLKNKKNKNKNKNKVDILLEGLNIAISSIEAIKIETINALNLEKINKIKEQEIKKSINKLNKIREIINLNK